MSLYCTWAAVALGVLVAGVTAAGGLSPKPDDPPPKSPVAKENLEHVTQAKEFAAEATGSKKVITTGCREHPG